MQGILHIVHTLWTCARISFNFLRKTYTFCMEGLYIFHGTAAHILWKNYTFSTETLPIFYRTVIHFVRKSCIFSTENPVHIRFYGSVMHLLRNSYTFSKEVLNIFYGTRVSLTGHRIYDVYDLCQYYKNDKLRLFNVSILKSICEHFEIPFKSRDRKSDLIFKVGEMISECQCCSSTDE